MSSKRKAEASIVSETWSAHCDSDYNLHKPIDKKKLDALQWVAAGSGEVATVFDPTYGPRTATFIVIGRIENNIISYKLNKDGGWTGRFPNFEGHKLSCILTRAFPNDNIDGVPLYETWPNAMNSLNTVGLKKAKTKGLTKIFDVTLPIGHKLFEASKIEDSLAGEDEEEDDESPPARPEDSLYAPIDPRIHKSLTMEGWPWGENTAARTACAALIKSHRIVPLPAYNAETSEVVLPQDYSKFQGALVCVHFALRWHYIPTKKGHAGQDECPDRFLADIKRIDFLKSGIKITASPSKRARVTFTSPSEATPEEGSNSST